VVAHEHIGTAGKGKGVFQLCPAGEDHFEVIRQLDGKGNIAPRSSQDVGRPSKTLATESSLRMWMSLSWRRKKSAISERRWQASSFL